jgi:pentatricopeptide repeat protein
MHVPAWFYLKRPGVFITRSFKVVWSQMSLRGIAWLTCMRKWGSMEDALKVFYEMPSQVVVTWTAILGGCA